MTAELAFLQAGFVHYQIQINTTGKNEANSDSAQAHSSAPSLLTHRTQPLQTRTQHTPLLSTFCTVVQRNWWASLSSNPFIIQLQRGISPIPYNLWKTCRVSGGLCLHSPEDWKEHRAKANKGCSAHSVPIQELDSNKWHFCLTGPNKQKAVVLHLTHSSHPEPLAAMSYQYTHIHSSTEQIKSTEGYLLFHPWGNIWT